MGRNLPLPDPAGEDLTQMGRGGDWGPFAKNANKKNRPGGGFFEGREIAVAGVFPDIATLHIYCIFDSKVISPVLLPYQP